MKDKKHRLYARNSESTRGGEGEAALAVRGVRDRGGAGRLAGPMESEHGGCGIHSVYEARGNAGGDGEPGSELDERGEQSWVEIGCVSKLILTSIIRHEIFEMNICYATSFWT